MLSTPSASSGTRPQPINLRSACALSSPALVVQPGRAVPPDALIMDPKGSMDLCLHPGAFEQHGWAFDAGAGSDLGSGSGYGGGGGAMGGLVFSGSKTGLNSDSTSPPQSTSPF